MKKREFIAAICFICIFGMLVTVQVKRFVSSPSQRADMQEYTASKEYELKRTDQTGPVLKKGAELQQEMRQAEAADIREETRAEQEQGGSDTRPRVKPEYPEGRARGNVVSDRDMAAASEPEELKEGAAETSSPNDFSASESALANRAAGAASLEDSEAAKEAADDTGNGALKAAGGTAQSRVAAAAETEPQTAASAQELQQSSREAASGDLISPASETADVSETEAEKEEQATAQAYQRELDSAAASIKKLKSSETDTSTWSYLNLADYELKLWDDLLNRIYQDIMEHMGETETEELRKEEKAWIKQRDADAKKVSSRYSGGALEGLEHTASLAKSTKERAYQLLEDYGSFLPQEEVSEEK